MVSRIGAYAADRRARVLLGQRKSTIVLSEVIRDGLVLLVSTAAGTVGRDPAALIGGTVIALVDSAMREQEKMPAYERRKCMLMVDEFQTILGVDWESMLTEIRKYGCYIMLATQSLARLDTLDRNLKDGVLDNCGCIVAYQVSAENARILAGELDRYVVSEENLVALDPYEAYVRLNTDTKKMRAFSMRTLPPPQLPDGADSAYDAVMEAMHQYTKPWSDSGRESLTKSDDMGPDELLASDGNAPAGWQAELAFDPDQWSSMIEDGSNPDEFVIVGPTSRPNGASWGPRARLPSGDPRSTPTAEQQLDLFDLSGLGTTTQDQPISESERAEAGLDPDDLLQRTDDLRDMQRLLRNQSRLGNSRSE